MHLPIVLGIKERRTLTLGEWAIEFTADVRQVSTMFKFFGRVFI